MSDPQQYGGSPPQGGKRPRGRRDGRHRRGFWGRIRTYFLTGVLVTTPFAITIYLASLFIDFVDAKVMVLIPEQYNPSTYSPFGLPGLGVLLVFIFLVLIGATAAGLVGRSVLRLGERFMGNMPVLRTVYKAAKQILETFMSQQSSAFRQVVLVQYPHKGVWVLGFLTGDPGGEIQKHTDDYVLGVMVPTTPNPTSGYLLYYPDKDIVRVDISVEEAMRIIISMGIVGTDARPSPTPPEPGAPITIDDALRNREPPENPG